MYDSTTLRPTDLWGVDSDMGWVDHGIIELVTANC